MNLSDFGDDSTFPLELFLDLSETIAWIAMKSGTDTRMTL